MGVGLDEHSKTQRSRTAKVIVVDLLKTGLSPLSLKAAAIGNGYSSDADAMSASSAVVCKPPTSRICRSIVLETTLLVASVQVKNNLEYTTLQVLGATIVSS